MICKKLFLITLIIPLGLSASQANSSNLVESKVKNNVLAYVHNVHLSLENRSVGANTENDSEDNPVTSCFDGIIRMQEKTANLYKAQNQMLEKLSENQENFHKELQALRAENDKLKKRISELEKQKK